MPAVENRPAEHSAAIRISPEILCLCAHLIGSAEENGREGINGEKRETTGSFSPGTQALILRSKLLLSVLVRFLQPILCL